MSTNVPEYVVRTNTMEKAASFVFIVGVILWVIAIATNVVVTLEGDHAIPQPITLLTLAGGATAITSAVVLLVVGRLRHGQVQVGVRLAHCENAVKDLDERLLDQSSKLKAVLEGVDLRRVEDEQFRVDLLQQIGELTDAYSRVFIEAANYAVPNNIRSITRTTG